MEAEFKTFRGRPIEDSNWYFAIKFILGEKRANRWVKTVSIPLGMDDDG